MAHQILTILQTADWGSEELLNAVEELIFLGRQLSVDEALLRRFGEGEEAELQERLTSEGEKFIRATKGRGWNGAFDFTEIAPKNDTET